MPIKIGAHTFEGPYNSTNSLKDHSGVYVILCLDGKKWIVIDVGESGEVKTRIENHNRATCWRTHCKGTIYCAVFYTPYKQPRERSEMERKIREWYKPVCGKR